MAANCAFSEYLYPTVEGDGCIQIRGGSSPKWDVRTVSAEREVNGGPGAEPPEKFFETTPFRLSDNAPFLKMSRERPTEGGGFLLNNILFLTRLPTRQSRLRPAHRKRNFNFRSN